MNFAFKKKQHQLEGEERREKICVSNSRNCFKCDDENASGYCGFRNKQEERQSPSCPAKIASNILADHSIREVPAKPPTLTTAILRCCAAAECYCMLPLRCSLLLLTARTRRQLGAVVIQLGVVDEILVLRVDVDRRPRRGRRCGRRRCRRRRHGGGRLFFGRCLLACFVAVVVSSAVLCASVRRLAAAVS